MSERAREWLPQKYLDLLSIFNYSSGIPIDPRGTPVVLRQLQLYYTATFFIFSTIDYLFTLRSSLS
jgi:hypothetical protein